MRRSHVVADQHNVSEASLSDTSGVLSLTLTGLEWHSSESATPTGPSQLVGGNRSATSRQSDPVAVRIRLVGRRHPALVGVEPLSPVRRFIHCSGGLRQDIICRSVTSDRDMAPAVAWSLASA